MSTDSVLVQISKINDVKDWPATISITELFYYYFIILLLFYYYFLFSYFIILFS